MAQSPTSSAVRALQLELKKIQEEPVEGFRVRLLNEDNIFEWEVAIFGPPGTLYEGGYFKVKYPESPSLVLSSCRNSLKVKCEEEKQDPFVSVSTLCALCLRSLCHTTNWACAQ